jgi:hypothetical protein
VAGFTVWGALSFSALVLLSAALLHRAVAREPDVFVARVILLGFVAKLVGTAARYWMITDLYGRGDALRYLSNGTEIAAGLREGSLPEGAWATGTPSMDFLAGIVFAVTQPRMLHGFLLFSLLSFLGAYLAFRAFTLAFPEGDRRRYAVLVLLFPTMVFWPSSMGKEAWLVFGLGVAAYGGARLLRRMRGGYVLAVAGVAAVFWIRPHMGALLALTLLIGFAVRFRDPDVQRGATAWVIGLVILGAGAGYALDNWGELLPRDEDIEGTTFDQVTGETLRRTSTGGSAFDSRPVRSPADLGHALVTVPFRPFPWEANNLQAVLSALEGMALLGLFIASIPRLRQLPRFLLRRPYVAFATAYTLGFVVAFSNVGNFGILVRQRAQLLPFLAVLLCLPPLSAEFSRRRRRRQEAAEPAPERVSSVV